MRLLLLFLALPLLAHATDQVAGDWSQPDHGLRARLVIAPSHEPQLDKTYDVILELQEVGIATSRGTDHQPLTIRYQRFAATCAVTDAKGKSLGNVGMGVGGLFWGGADLVLPSNGLLSFPIGSGGGTLGKDDPGPGRILNVEISNRWVIPPSGGPYTLSYTLQIPNNPKPPAHESDEMRLENERYRGWRGPLTPPPIVVPEQ